MPGFYAGCCLKHDSKAHSTGVRVDVVSKFPPWTSWATKKAQSLFFANPWRLSLLLWGPPDGTLIEDAAPLCMINTPVEWRSPWNNLKVSIRAGHILGIPIFCHPPFGLWQSAGGQNYALPFRRLFDHSKETYAVFPWKYVLSINNFTKAKLF